MVRKYFGFSFLVCLMIISLNTGVNAQNPDLPKAPEWEFETISSITQAMPELTPHNKNNNNPIYDNQKVIDSWGYKAKPWTEAKDLFPEALYNMFINPEIWGNFRINETAYIPRSGRIHELYMAATEKYKGQPYLDEDNWLRNYKAGLPFPDVDVDNDPKAAIKLMWNHMKRAKGEGDRTHDSFIILVDRAGREKFVNSGRDRMFFFGRLEHEPKPVYTPNPNQLDYLMCTVNKLPYNVAGTIALINRYDIAGRNDDMRIYIPTMRRVRRMSTSERQDKMSGGKDFIWDNVETFDGQISNYNFELVETKDMLLPLCAMNTPSDVKGKYFCGVDDYWQRRKTYVIKAIPKKPVNITETVLYMDAEEYISTLGVVKDTKGRDWMVSIYTYNRGAGGELNIFHGTSVDLITRHASKNYNVHFSYGLDYNPGMFEMEELKRKFLVR